MRNFYYIILTAWLSLFTVAGLAQTTHCEFTVNGKHYTGQCKNGIPHGEGEQINPDGSRFNGTFMNGARSYGVYSWPDRKERIEKAVYKDDKLVSGIYYFPDGAYYIGTFVNDKFDGKGIFYYEDGSKEKMYDGEFRQGKFHGEGKKVYRDNRVQDGGWYNNRFIGIDIGKYNNKPVYWDQMDSITIFASGKVYNIYKHEPRYSHQTVKTTQLSLENQNIDIADISYIYIKEGNHITAVVKTINSHGHNFSKTKYKHSVIFDTDKKLLDHLNRNQYNKPVKGKLTHLYGRLYYDENKCVWYLYNKASSIYHNEPGAYKNIKLVRQKPGTKQSFETVLRTEDYITEALAAGVFPKTITGEQIKTGPFQQTFNYHHANDVDISELRIDYKTWLPFITNLDKSGAIKSAADYLLGHKEADVDPHVEGWIHYAEFPQIANDEASGEELEMIENAQMKVIGQYQGSEVRMLGDTIKINKDYYMLSQQKGEQECSLSLAPSQAVYVAKKRGENDFFAGNILGYITKNDDDYAFTEIVKEQIGGKKYKGRSVYITKSKKKKYITIERENMVYILENQIKQNIPGVITRYFLTTERDNVLTKEDAENSVLGWVDEYIGNKYEFEVKADKIVKGINLFGSIYIGPINPVGPDDNDNYYLPTQDPVDVAAKKHDLCYDDGKAVGASGAFFNTGVINCDKDLYTRCFYETVPSIAEKLYNGLDSLTEEDYKKILTLLSELPNHMLNIAVRGAVGYSASKLKELCLTYNDNTETRARFVGIFFLMTTEQFKSVIQTLENLTEEAKVFLNNATEVAKDVLLSPPSSYWLDDRNTILDDRNPVKENHSNTFTV